MVNGFLNVNKPSGITSNKVLGILKHALRSENINTKVGHFGTLDPLATGVLPVALGRATRLFDYSLDKVKEYEADFILGADSDSLDTDTEVHYSDFRIPSTEKIEAALKTQLGEIMQIPPAYSAKSIGGVRAYKLARKGEDVKLLPKKITVYEIEVIRIVESTVTVKIKCSGGTYIRSIGRDFAAELGTTAVMSRLVRTASGFFNIENSIALADLETYRDLIASSIIPITEYLRNYKKVEITQTEKESLLNGKRLNRENHIDLCEVTCDGETVGIGKSDENGQFFVKTWLL